MMAQNSLDVMLYRPDEYTFDVDILELIEQFSHEGEMKHERTDICTETMFICMLFQESARNFQLSL